MKYLGVLIILIMMLQSVEAYTYDNPYKPRINDPTQSQIIVIMGNSSGSGSGSNSSFNETYDSGIPYWYNYTRVTLTNATACNPGDKVIGLNYSNGIFSVTCALDLTGAGNSLNDYNHTLVVMGNATINDGIKFWYNQTWTLGTFNETYDAGMLWWYNQSLALYNQFNSQWNSTYNATYHDSALNSYNHTLVVMGNTTINNGLPLWYNHTQIVMGNITINNGIPYWYNHTLIMMGNTSINDALKMTYNHTLVTMGNATINTGIKFWYNHTLITMGNASINNGLPLWYNHTQIVMQNTTINNGLKFWYNFTSLGLTNATACNPATDKAIGLNYSNGVFSVTCATDLTGGAGVNDYNHTLISMQNTTMGNINSTRDLNNGNISCTQIKGNGGDADFCADATGAGASTPDYYQVDLSCENLLVDTFNSQTTIETGEVGMLGWGYTATGGSAAVATPTKGNHPGVIRLSTGTGVRGNITFELGQASKYWDSFAGNTTQTWVLNVSKPMTPQDNYSLYVGFMDNSGTVVQPVDCLGFFTNETVNGNWTAMLCLNNARYLNVTNWKVNETQYVNLNVSVTNQSGGKHRMDWYMRLEGQTAWSLVATTDALNPPNTVARATGPAVVLKKFGGTTAITADIDYYWDKSRFNVCR